VGTTGIDSGATDDRAEESEDADELGPTARRYFRTIENELDAAREIAETARDRGEDPSPDVEIPVARDMADRVETVLEIDGVADRVRELEADHDREEIAILLAEDFAAGRIGTGGSPAETVEAAVRTAVALLTEGVVAAPIEGIDGVTEGTNGDGSSFVRVEYAGPIRSAGGTAQALSVLVADYTRTLLDVDEYQPREDEVERLVEEVALYDQDTGLQYTPSDDEVRLIARNLPVMLDGEPTTDDEVSGYRDLERIESNRARGGLCLVLAEGIAQKVPKIRRYTDALDELDWPWLGDLKKGATTGAANGEADEDAGNATDEPTDAGPPRPDPNDTYLRDLIAGRPVLGHPSQPGGFRLRYGRARNHGLATAGVHPATMELVRFLAPGTQLKTERPGKAAGVVPVDGIAGPTVRLASGEVRRIDDPEEARDVRNGVDAILDLGEYLVNAGEFVENNQPLAPAAYTAEWWAHDAAASGLDVQALRDDAAVDISRPSAERALAWADQGAPLHPVHTHLWHDVEVDDLERLAAVIAGGEVTADDTLRVADSDAVRETLEALLVVHERTDEGLVIPTWRPLARSAGVTTDLERTWTRDDLPDAATSWPNAMRAVRHVAPFDVRERAPTRVGARMGRPEKSEPRELSPAVHTLFPLGEAGGDQRDVVAAANRSERGTAPGVVEVTVGDRAAARRGEEPNPQPRDLDLAEELQDALDAVSEREATFEILKGVKGLTSAGKVPEPLEKGILRAKHDVSAFKDGTVRYDLTDLPVTAVRPEEIGVTPDQLRELGYETDVNGDPLAHDDQLVPLRVQDVVLSTGAGDHLARTADFVDDLLTDYYGLDPYYEADDREDLIGELVFGMAPHTSAAVVGRIIGYTSAAVGYAHPYFHAAKRRNCDGDEDCVMLLMDGLLNFSRAYLPDKRGGRMDAPLVMTSRIDPAEIDDEAHNVDAARGYSRAFYEATREAADPGDTDITLAGDAVGTPAAYGYVPHTTDPSDIAAGPDLSAYKTLGPMDEKTDEQLELARKLRSVDESDVAERIIEYHFLPDLIGNLRAFAGQTVRCLDCGTDFRRPPLSGSCRECGGDVTLTVYEGSVSKYVETATEVAEAYDARPYTKQRLEILERSIESIFQDDTNRPSTLGEFM
jgi:DNA polymerase II large subunit